MTRSTQPTRPAEPPYTRSGHEGALQWSERQLGQLRAYDEAAVQRYAVLQRDAQALGIGQFGRLP